MVPGSSNRPRSEVMGNVGAPAAALKPLWDASNTIVGDFQLFLDA